MGEGEGDVGRRGADGGWDVRDGMLGMGWDGMGWGRGKGEGGRGKGEGGRGKGEGGGDR